MGKRAFFCSRNKIKGVTNAYLLDSLGDLAQTDVEMELLLLQPRPLLVVEPDEVVDEVQEVPGGDGHDALAALDGAGVDLVQRLVHVDHGGHDGVAVVLDVLVHGELGEVGREPVGAVQVHLQGELLADLRRNEPLRHCPSTFLAK